MWGKVKSLLECTIPLAADCRALSERSIRPGARRDEPEVERKRKARRGGRRGAAFHAPWYHLDLLQHCDTFSNTSAAPTSVTIASTCPPMDRLLRRSVA